MNATPAEAVQRAHATQQLVNQVLHHGANSRMVCATCDAIRDHRSLRLESVVYTVCRTCHAVTTSA